MGVRIPSEPVPTTPEPGQRPDPLLYHGVRVGILLGLAVITYALFPSAAAVDYPIFEIGSVATENVIAPFAYTVPKTQAELTAEREELAGSVKPSFVYLPAALDSSIDALDSTMAEIADSGQTNERGRVLAVQRAAVLHDLRLTPAEAEYLAIPTRRRAMQDAVRRVFSRWLSSGITTTSQLEGVRGDIILKRGAEERSVPVDSLLTFGSLLSRARQMHPDPNSSVGDALYLKLLSTFFRPTVALDRADTERRRQELRNTIDPNKYTVRSGEKIVGEHEVVGRAEFEKMRALHESMQARSGGERAVSRIVGGILYNALVLAIFGIAVVLFRPQLYDSLRALALFALVFLLVLGGSAITAHLQPVHPELVPVALAAIILSLMFDPRISMIAAMILAVLVGGQSVFRGTNALFLNLVGGAAAALSARVLLRREQAYQYVLVISVAYLFAALAIGLTLGWTAGEIARSSALGVVNGAVSVIVAVFLIPLAERVTGTTTHLTLIEYSDLNRPLLKRLSLEAPGTYAHTIAMANLVEAACTAIGANGLLGRVGTYYHDIGKLNRPQYFAENQAGGRNPHDKLNPGTSASIIRDHIREGLALASEHHLPAAITAFIPEHHGTGQITYFLERAKERDGLPRNAEIFAYPGPIPQTAETAICMLADGVEASVRVLADPTPGKIREVIDHIVRQRIEQGQLANAPLTLQQLDVVKDQFARVLAGMYHNRIDYPAASGGVTSEFASV
ncbi:MAG TPA: HDIG domain-containing protein [Gemmatimonadaceae bacterium]|nr:HDIG domain-containing protein [Gemmatimonadaceae bacterium]